MTLRFFALLCLALAHPLTAGEHSNLKLRRLAEFDLRSEAGGVVLPLKLGGEDRGVVLDTGSLGHFLDESLADVLGPKLPAASGVTPGGQRMFQRRSFPAGTDICGLPLGTGEAALFDAQFLSKEYGRRVFGTVGLDLLRQGCWIFDFDDGRLIVGERLDPSAEDTSAVPKESLLHLPVQFPDGMTLPFMLDTGAAGWGTLSNEVFDSLVAQSVLRVLPEKASMLTSAGAVANVPQGVVGGLKLNGHALPELTLVRSDRNRLGWRIFACFNWQIDLSRSEIFMLPRKSPPPKLAAPSPTQTTQKP